ncbi:MAG: hypothetical protein WAW37_06075 [Syntrophobacteraceae bacterium]
MEDLLNLFGTQPNLGGILQIGLDIVILGTLAALLAGKRRKVSLKDEAVIESFGKIIEEAGVISREFEANLAQRQELIRDITARLDQRLQEAQDLCARLERLERTGAESLKALSEAAEAPMTGRHASRNDHQKVLILAKKGMNPTEIAKSLKKPLGEVELILNLQKIAS